MPSRPKKNGTNEKPHEPYAGAIDVTAIKKSIEGNQVQPVDNTTALVEKEKPKGIPAAIQEQKTKVEEPKAPIKIPAMQQEKVFTRYDFSDAEKLAIGQRAAQAHSRIAGLKDELKSINMDFKSKIKGHETELSTATEQMNSGFEMREMECNVLYNRDAKPPFKAFYRVDNGSFVRRENMNTSDLSMLCDPWPKNHRLEDNWTPPAPKK